MDLERVQREMNTSKYIVGNPKALIKMRKT